MSGCQPYVGDVPPAGVGLWLRTNGGEWFQPTCQADLDRHGYNGTFIETCRYVRVRRAPNGETIKRIGNGLVDFLLKMIGLKK